VRYEDLFPGQTITDREDYINGNPWTKQHAALIHRLIYALENRAGRPLREVYRQVFEEFQHTTERL
jgi:hypothetical protein